MHAGDPRISVVIATRNRVASLLRTLDALASLPERPRVIVIDNGSTDGTPQEVAARGADLDLVALEENAGAAARNIGVRTATSPYVAFSDDDSWWAPGSLSEAADVFERYPSLAVVAGQVLVGPENRADEMCKLYERSPLRSNDDLPGPPVLGFIACGAVVRREAFVEAGGFSKRLEIGGEEELLALDLAARGWYLAYVRQIVAHHHPAETRDVALRRRRLVRNALWILWLRRPLPDALRHTRSIIAATLQDGYPVAGVLDAVRGAGWVAANRRVVPDPLARSLRLLDDMPERLAKRT